MRFSDSINWLPIEYADKAVVSEEARAEMLARLEFIMLKPGVILDLGCGTAAMASQLQARYSNAQIIACDNAQSMIEHTRLQHQTVLCTDAKQLPLPSQSVDMIIANLLLPWDDDPQTLLKEWRRVLRPDGLLMLSALGPDTLREWRAQVNNEDIPYFMDMHDIGDLMLQEGFADPVLDVNYLTLTYKDQQQLIAELKLTGMLATNAELNNIHEVVANADGSWEVTYELIHAHAFAPAIKDEISASADGMVRVPLSYLRRQIRK